MKQRDLDAAEARSAYRQSSATSLSLNGKSLIAEKALQQKEFQCARPRQVQSWLRALFGKPVLLMPDVKNRLSVVIVS